MSFPPTRRDALKLLVIEDDDQDWKLIERALNNASTVKFEYDRVSHLNNALTVLRHKRYDCILLDLILQFDGPANGIDTVVAVTKEATDTPIIVLTALHDIDMAVQAVEYGVSAYIEKPPAAHRLESSVRQAVERHIRDEIARRLTWESLQKYTHPEETSALAAAIGGHIDNLEQGIFLIREYLSGAAPQHAAEVDRILGWGHIMISLREIRRALKLSDELLEEADTLPPDPAQNDRITPVPRRKRRRALSDRALQHIRHSGSGFEKKILTPEDAKAYLLDVQTAQTGNGDE